MSQITDMHKCAKGLQEGPGQGLGNCDEVLSLARAVGWGVEGPDQRGQLLGSQGDM